MNLHLRSSAFENNEAFPLRYTRAGSDCSPPLRWSGVPEGCAGLALLCEDLDAAPGASVHWILFGIPAAMTELPEGLPSGPDLPWGGRQGENSFGRTGYTGPGPRGDTTHRYQFTLFALDTEPSLSAGMAKREFLRAINGTVVARTHLTGTCLRRRTVRRKPARRQGRSVALVAD